MSPGSFRVRVRILCQLRVLLQTVQNSVPAATGLMDLILDWRKLRLRAVRLGHVEGLVPCRVGGSPKFVF